MGRETSRAWPAVDIDPLFSVHPLQMGIGILAFLTRRRQRRSIGPRGRDGHHSRSGEELIPVIPLKICLHFYALNIPKVCFILYTREP